MWYNTLMLFHFFNWSLRNPVFDFFMPAVSFLFEPMTVGVLLVLGTIISFFKPSWRREIWKWWLLMLVLGAVAIDLKTLVNRDRPFRREAPVHFFYAGRWQDLQAPLPASVELPFLPTPGFPSGHALGAFGVVGYLWRRVKKKWKIVLLIGGFLVALSRVYLGVHYPIDVVVGGLLGFAIGYLCRRVV